MYISAEFAYLKCVYCELILAFNSIPCTSKLQSNRFMKKHKHEETQINTNS